MNIWDVKDYLQCTKRVLKILQEDKYVQDQERQILLTYPFRIKNNTSNDELRRKQSNYVLVLYNLWVKLFTEKEVDQSPYSLSQIRKAHKQLSQLNKNEQSQFERLTKLEANFTKRIKKACQYHQLDEATSSLILSLNNTKQIKKQQILVKSQIIPYHNRYVTSFPIKVKSQFTMTEKLQQKQSDSEKKSWIENYHAEKQIYTQNKKLLKQFLTK